MKKKQEPQKNNDDLVENKPSFVKQNWPHESNNNNPSKKFKNNMGEVVACKVFFFFVTSFQ